LRGVVGFHGKESVMRACFSPVRIVCLLTVTFATAFASMAHAAKIEAVEGKHYNLSKQHGPWMIMVASFLPNSDDATPDDESSASQAADELVLELRKLNLPAYVYKVNGDDGMISTVDRLGRGDRRKNLRKLTSYGVIAGNYDSADDRLAQKTLEYIKKLKPTTLDNRTDVVWYGKSGEFPLHNAFLSPNPLLTAEEVASRKGVDPLLLRLNANENYSLLENHGQYTVQVAMFTGRRVLAGSASSRRQESSDEGRMSPLDVAADEARDLATALRVNRKIEAYVWHDHYQSIVTVGSFKTPSDVDLRETVQKFKAKDQLNVKTGFQESTPELLWIPDPEDGGATTRMWAFMPQPVVMTVPRINPRASQIASAAERRASR
jgi:hypothetical protein